MNKDNTRLECRTCSAPLITLRDSQESEDRSVCIVRVSSSTWYDARGVVHIDKRITPLKRKSEGYQIFSEDVQMIGASEVIEKIVNLSEIEDGIFLVLTCNHSHDWESGTLDDYDYYLSPYSQQAIPGSVASTVKD